MFDAEKIIRDQEEMAQERRPFETMMQECAELLLPRQSNFQNLGSLWQGRNLVRMSPRRNVRVRYAQHCG